MRFFNISSLLLLSIVMLLVACDQETFDEITVGTPSFQPDTVEVNSLVKAIRATPDDGLDLGCISIQFPFDLALASGTSLMINSTSDFEAAVSEEAPDQAVNFVYPLMVVTEDGARTSVNDNEALGVLFGACIPTDGWDEAASNSGTLTIPAFLFAELCFDLVYPLEVEDANANIYTVNGEATLIDLLATTPNLAFILPITVVDEDGSETTIESVAGFYKLYYTCEGVSPPETEGGIEIDFSDLNGENCDFETLAIQYPYDVVTEDGERITVEDENQEAALILNGENYTLQYPFNLVDATGTVVSINDEAEFILSILPCLVTPGEPDSCNAEAHVLLFFNGLNIFTVNKYEYEINFPVTLIVEGTSVVVNNGDEYLPAVGGSPANLLETEIVYPVTVTQFGRDFVLNSDEDVCQFYSTLDEPCPNKPAHIQFFFNEGVGTRVNCAYLIDYPLEIVRNGVTIQVPTRADYLNELNGSPTAYDEIGLVYPVSMTRLNDGQQIVFEADDDICAYLESCE